MQVRGPAFKKRKEGRKKQQQIIPEEVVGRDGVGSEWDRKNSKCGKRVERKEREEKKGEASHKALAVPASPPLLTPQNKFKVQRRF